MTDSEKKPILSEPIVTSQPYPQPYQQPQMGPPVVVGQPEFGTIQGKLVCSVDGHREWSTGLFDCTQDMTNAVMVCCCTPCVEMQLATRLGECACFPFCVPGGLVVLRTRVRTLGGIQGSICMDGITTLLCAHCALCQIKRELDNMDIF